MKLITAPEKHVGQHNERRVFLAGGITGAPEWQDEMAELLRDTDLVLFNPRRKGFDVRQKDIQYEQIGWEFRHLRMADAILFWFPYPAQCMISLYELGIWSERTRNQGDIFVGVDPQYIRCEDIEIQIGLARPEIEIVYSLKGLAHQVKEWSKL
jgi:hypothetical protein